MMSAAYRHLVKLALLAVACCSLLAGCAPERKDCGLVNKTEEQCRQELPDKGVFCQGVLERVEYVTVERYRAAGSVYALLRFRDGSSCLTDDSFDPLSVNGIAAGTAVQVVWKRLPVEKHWCCDGGFGCRPFKDACDHVQVIEIGNAEAVPQ